MKTGTNILSPNIVCIDNTSVSVRWPNTSNRIKLIVNNIFWLQDTIGRFKKEHQQVIQVLIY